MSRNTYEDGTTKGSPIIKKGKGICNGGTMMMAMILGVVMMRITHLAWLEARNDNDDDDHDRDNADNADDHVVY